jgi:hypothetical protein
MRASKSTGAQKAYILRQGKEGVPVAEIGTVHRELMPLCSLTVLFQVARTVTGLAVGIWRLTTLTWIAVSLHCAPKARACRRLSQLAFSLPMPVSRC